jgi:hypothetical protein
MPLKLRLSYPARSLPPNAGPLRHQHDKLQKHKPKPKPKLGSTLLSHHKAFGIVETQQNQKHKTKPPQSHTHITSSLTQSITHSKIHPTTGCPSCRNADRAHHPKTHNGERVYTDGLQICGNRIEPPNSYYAPRARSHTQLSQLTHFKTQQ